MQTLVTGSTGFVGAHVCRALVEAGHAVRAFHRPASRLVALNGVSHLVERVQGDVFDPDSIRSAMVGVDWAFHTAGRVAHWREGAALVASIVSGTKNVLDAALAAGVRRLIFTSSVAALGVSHDGQVLDETHSFNYAPDRWPYGYAKHLAEGQVRQAAAAGLNCVIVNPTSVFGSGDLNRVAGELIIQVARRRVPVVPPGGMNVVHVSDVAAGHLAAAERGRPGERYILGGDNLTHAEVLRVVAEEVGLRPPTLRLPAVGIELAASAADLIRRFAPLPYNGDLLRLARYFFHYDTAKARRELGLPAPRPFRQAIRQAVAWYRANGYL